MRKGQITLFVALGLVALLIVGLLIMSNGSDEELSQAASNDRVRITSLVESCIATQGESIMREIGRQGGHLYLEQFSDLPDMRDTQVVTVGPQKVVLWNEVHRCSENALGCPGDNRPPLCRDDEGCPIAYRGSFDQMSIEEQLEMELNERLQTCFDAQELPDLQITIGSKPDADAMIRPQDIQIDVNFPLSVIASDGIEIEIKRFQATLDLNIAQIYEVASKVQKTHLETAFIEEAFRHLLSIYGGVGTPIPPVREIEMFGGEDFWIRSQVQEEVESGILPFLNLMQIYNTRDSFYPLAPPNDTDPIYAPYATGIYKYLTIKLDNETYDLESSFEYPNTPIYLDVNGKELLRPQGLGDGGFLSKMSGMFVKEYNFKYTAQFPLIYEIEDRVAFGGRGFEFDIGLEANLYKNYPLNLTKQFVEVSSITPAVDLTAPNQLIDHRYDVKVTDRRTGEEIPSVAISYACGSTYPMGATNPNGVWRGKLPYCFGDGALIAGSARHFQDGTYVQNVDEDGETTDIEFQLWERAKRPVQVYKRTSADLMQMRNDPEGIYRTGLSQDEYVFLRLNRVKQAPYQGEAPLASAVQYGKTSQDRDPQEVQARMQELLDEGQITQEEYDLIVEQASRSKTNRSDDVKYVDLVPGLYEVEAMLIHNGIIHIPAKVTPDYTLNATNFTGWLIGGANMVGPDVVEITEEMVYSNEPIVFYVLDLGIPRSWDDLQNARDVDEMQAGNERYLQPTLS